ncbi:MAG: PhnD/SsuA/transferrin family substrate-binding protein [Pseudomonadota bacterium]|nr:MAG: PhnD/SsuA/transferrin family substrate-binding protein [Pseudomonadota bacterium]
MTAVAALVAVSVASAASPERLVLLVHPVLSEERTKQTYQPLADFLTRAAGVEVAIATRPNFFAYWDTVRKPDTYHLAFDEAHFTDYRIVKLGFSVLVKMPDSVSYTLVAPDNKPIIDPMNLAGKTIATLGPPSIGAARLGSMFPNPARQPSIVMVDDAEDGMRRVLTRKVAAAILPTPIVSRQLSHAGGITVVATTEPVPHSALSAAPTVTPVMRERIRAALLSAHRSPDGQRMLAGIGVTRFDPATEETYANQSAILRQYWGY